MLATVETPLLPLTSTTKPATVWLAASQELSVATPGSPREAPLFVLDITLTTPSPLSITTVLKPLLDGLISAFHAHDSSDGHVLVQRIAQATAAAPRTVAQLLGLAAPPLGRRRLAWPWRDGVQWNPADDRCVACRITLARGAWALRAELSTAVDR